MIPCNLKNKISIKRFHFEQLASVSNEKLKHESTTRMHLKIECIALVRNYTIGHHVFLQIQHNSYTSHEYMSIVAHTHCSRLKIGNE